MKGETGTDLTIFGIRPVIEALEAGKTFDKVFVQKGLRGSQSEELLEALKSYKVNVKTVPVEKLNRLTRKTHQGVFGFLSPIEFEETEALLQRIAQAEKAPLLLLLDRVTDVRNFGAIVRTAECAGVDAVVIPKHESAPVSADAVKTSTGALFRVPVCKVDNLADFIFSLKSEDIQVVAGTEKTEDLLYDTDFRVPTALVMGNEEKGISNQILKICDRRAKLPLAGSIGSLNVSVATGALLYEAVRQRR